MQSAPLDNKHVDRIAIRAFCPKLKNLLIILVAKMKLTSNYNLATYILESSIRGNQNDVFGTNGLPLTPPSIKMVGNFQSFVASSNAANQSCPYLTTYLDCIRSKNGLCKFMV